MLPAHVHVGFGEIGVCNVKSVDQDRWSECKMIIINVQYVLFQCKVEQDTCKGALGKLWCSVSN